MEDFDPSAPYNLGWSCGFDTCSVGKYTPNPFPDGSPESEQWERGFDDGVETYEVM